MSSKHIWTSGQNACWRKLTHGLVMASAWLLTTVLAQQPANQNLDKALAALDKIPPQQLKAMVATLKPEQVRDYLDKLSKDKLRQIFTLLTPKQLQMLADSLTTAQLTALQDKVPPPVLMQIFAVMTPQKKASLMKELSDVQRTRLQQLLDVAEAAAKRQGQLPMANRQNMPVKMYINLSNWQLEVVTQNQENDRQEKLRQAVEAGQLQTYKDSVYCPGVIELIHLPAGVFLMGSSPSENHRMCDEQRHEVELKKNFWMGRFEITQEQWKRVMGQDDRSDVTQPPPAGITEIPAKRRGDAYPMYNVSYEDAKKFCDNLQKLIRRAQAKSPYKLPGNMTVSLPTEAEWEYACRAGRQATYGFGNSLLARDAVFHIESITVTERVTSGGNNQNQEHGGMDMGERQDQKETFVTRRIAYTPTMKFVGTCNPNAFGLYDMHGSVWEWCHGSYYPYPAGKVTNPPGGRPRHGDGVARGGCWYSFARDCRAARRLDINPNTRQNSIGFRIVIVAENR